MQYLWAETNARELQAGDIVRVKSDAFKDKNLMQIHNLRILKVIRVENGEVVAKSIDAKLPNLDKSHYSPFHLEKKIEVK